MITSAVLQAGYCFVYKTQFLWKIKDYNYQTAS